MRKLSGIVFGYPFSWLLIILVFQQHCFAEQSTRIYKMVSSATVTIYTYELQDGRFEIGVQGSGFFVNPTTIATNYHVIKSAIYEGNYAVVLWKEKTFNNVLLTYYNPSIDIALLEVNTPGNKHYLRNGNHDAVQIGNKVYVVGAPLGLEQSLSEGIISGIRMASGWIRHFQITNAISPGSSGSPLVNMNGEHIGIVVASIVEGQNLNFAVSSGYIDYVIKTNNYEGINIGFVTSKQDSVVTSPISQRSLDEFCPESKNRILTVKDLQGKSPWELTICRNEIYARHGRKFERQDLQEYFNKKAWYKMDKRYNDSKLNTYEKRNGEFILEYQKKHRKME